jgi:hypothetical protein
MSMDLPSEERQIGGRTYRVSKLPLRQWFELKALVLRMAGPALSELIASVQGGISNFAAADIPAEGVGLALHRFCGAATADEMERVVTILSSATRVSDQLLGQGAAAWWPQHMSDMAPWLAFALGVQFSDFFEGLVATLPGVVVAAQSQSPTSSAITG